MKKRFARYMQFWIGTAAGFLTAVVLFLLATSGGTPFQSVPYLIREWNGNTIVHTPKFTILYKGVTGVNSGGSMTIAGHYGSVPTPWSGYGEGWGGSEKGIDSMHLYSPWAGEATVFVAGHVFRVGDDAKRLQVVNHSVDLGQNPPLVIVDKSYQVRVAGEDEIKRLLAAANLSEEDYFSAAPAKP